MPRAEIRLGPGERVAVIGDVGGHRAELAAELDRLGADPGSGTLPPELTVVQVGDLVHRGPDSVGVLELVDRYLRQQPQQWVQLLGNHEAQYLREPAFAWPERLPAAAADTLQRWWAVGTLQVAVAVGGAEPVLITHAGLTWGYWRRVLGSPADAPGTAAALNRLAADTHASLFRPGRMLGGGRANLTAGPLWADAAAELLPGWLGRTLPFGQVHGHSTLGSAAAEVIASRTTVDRDAAHEITVLPGGRIVGVDPGHGHRAARSWRSWVIEAARD